MSALPEPKGDRPQAEQPRAVADRPASRQDLSALARHLGSEHAKAQAPLEARLTEIEASLNRIEGRLFVELQPLVVRAVADGLAISPARRRRAGPAILLALAAFFLGAVLGGEIGDLGIAGISSISAPFVPDGGQFDSRLSD